MIFLKVLDAKEEKWKLESDDYEPIISEHLRGGNWAADDKGMIRDKLLKFGSNILFKELKEMELTQHSSPKTFFVKSIFKDSHNYMKSVSLSKRSN